MPVIPEFKPYYQTNNSGNPLCRFYLGDVRSVLKRLPRKSVHCVVTSPPYWGLRDYKTGSKFELGCERTVQEYVTNMVEVFTLIRRVLRDDGTVWLNLGDSYNSQSGNLVGVPWRVAFALQDSGWILRQDLIWSKPSPMPESVTNRCTKSHEYLFLLVKRKGYFYDAEAIKDKAITANLPTRSLGKKQAVTQYDGMVSHNENHASAVLERVPDSNKRSVWVISSQGYPGAHFATFPPKLVEPCIKAGTSEMGCCPECMAPWRRIVETTKLRRDRPNDYVKRTGEEGTGNSCSNSVAGVETKTIGWESMCNCGTDREDAIPCTVLDPFIGSGTTSAVALELGRHTIGIDLSEDYLRKNAIHRVEGVIQNIPHLRKKIKVRANRVELGSAL